MPFDKNDIKINRGGRPKGSLSKRKATLEMISSYFKSFKYGLDYYVYAHFCTLTNECLYIGKGCGGRAWHFANRLHTSKNIEVVILVCGIEEDEALEIEKILIKKRKPKHNIAHNK